MGNYLLELEPELVQFNPYPGAAKWRHLGRGGQASGPPVSRWKPAAEEQTSTHPMHSPLPANSEAHAKQAKELGQGNKVFCGRAQLVVAWIRLLE